MRTNDSPDPQPWRPLGERVQRAPAPKAPDWTPRPDAPHIEQDKSGRMRTNLPLPKGNP